MWILRIKSAAQTRETFLALGHMCEVNWKIKIMLVKINTSSFVPHLYKVGENRDHKMPLIKSHFSEYNTVGHHLSLGYYNIHIIIWISRISYMSQQHELKRVENNIVSFVSKIALLYSLILAQCWMDIFPNMLISRFVAFCIITVYTWWTFGFSLLLSIFVTL